MWDLLPALITRHNENFCACSSVLSFQACRTLDVELIWWSCRSTHGITWWSCCCLYVCRGLTRTRTLDDLCVSSTQSVWLFFLTSFVLSDFRWQEISTLLREKVSSSLTSTVRPAHVHHSAHEVFKHPTCTFSVCDPVCSVIVASICMFNLHSCTFLFLSSSIEDFCHYRVSDFFFFKFISPAWQTFLSSVHDIRAGS